MLEDPYLTLQKHLDSTAVGFPRSKSGVEMAILRKIYRPEDIPIMLALRDIDEPVAPT